MIAALAAFVLGVLTGSLLAAHGGVVLHTEASKGHTLCTRCQRERGRK